MGVSLAVALTSSDARLEAHVGCTQVASSTTHGEGVAELHFDAQALAAHAAGLLVVGAAFAVVRGEAAGQGSALFGGSGGQASWASSVLVSSCWAAATVGGLWMCVLS